MGRQSLQDMCFVMFVDRKTFEAELARNSTKDGRTLGAWRLVVVERLPYADMRLSVKVSGTGCMGFQLTASAVVRRRALAGFGESAQTLSVQPNLVTQTQCVDIQSVNNP